MSRRKPTARPMLPPGQVLNLGPVAGTAAAPGVPGIGAADLGEIVQLPNGKYVAVFGDAYDGKHFNVGKHFPSVAVPVIFGRRGRLKFGAPLTGPDGGNVLFPLPGAAKDAGANNTLPAGSIEMRDGSTYMMVVGTNTAEGLAPKGGTWLVRVTDDPARGWRAVPGSYRPWQSIPNPNAAPGAPPLISDPVHPPTQISGYQGCDGQVYIVADSFDRHHPVTMYSAEAAHVADRASWRPWTGNRWGSPGQPAAVISPANFGELSFREVDGKPVLSGFNAGTGNTEVRVGSGPPPDIFRDSTMTVLAAGGAWGEPGKVPQNYGGYIMPGATLTNMGILISQWNTTTGLTYVVNHFQVNTGPSRV